MICWHLVHRSLQEASLTHAKSTRSVSDHIGFQIDMCMCSSPRGVEKLVSDVELDAALVELGLLAGVAHRGHHHLPHHHRHRVRLLQETFFQLFN